jgi:hypothetical protein
LPVLRPNTTPKIKLPSKNLAVLLQDKALFRALCTYFELKTLYYSGHLRNVRARYPEFCEFLDISERTFRTRLKELEQLQLIEWKGKDIYLASYKFVCWEYLHTHPRNLKSVEFKARAKHLIRALSIQENFNRQQYEIIKKVRHNDKLRSSDEFDLRTNNFAPENRQRLIKTLNRSERKDVLSYWNAMTDYQKDSILFRVQKDTHKNLQKPSDFSTQIQMGYKVINGNVGLGCRAFSRLMGCSSAGMGSYWQQQLQAAGVLKVVRNSIKIFDDELAHFMQREFNEGDEIGAGYYTRPNNHPRQPRKRWDGYKVLPNILQPLIS